MERTPGNDSTQAQATLIVAVYNRADVLRLLLAACRRQTFADFEIIIADDGSGPGVREVVEEFTGREDLELSLVRHEDGGWRKNTILNEAVRRASGGYLVFIDGDCLPHSRFVEDHMHLKEKGRLLCGRRAEMSERWSLKLDMESIREGSFERLGIREWLDGITGRALRVEDGLRSSILNRNLCLHGKSRGILGSNFSLYKSDLETINGFDEEYDGPGSGEDSDIEFRLSLTGVTCKSLRHLAVQFHVYHPRTRPSPESLSRYEQVVARQQVRCTHGLESPATRQEPNAQSLHREGRKKSCE